MTSSGEQHPGKRSVDAGRYRKWCLRANGPWVANDGSQGFPFTERHLQCIWYDPALRAERLATDAGEMVSVLNPGTWNLEAGPDFLGAELLIEPDRRQVHGDIEIHIHPKDWEKHHHAADPRYQRIIAHVTYFHDPSPPRGLPAGALRLALQRLLSRKQDRQIGSIDVSAYPYAAHTQPCPCANLLLQRPGILDPDSFLQDAGAFRMEHKAHELARQLCHHSVDTVLYRNTMRTMGYKMNAQTFLDLADMVPVSHLHNQRPLQCYAHLMGAARLLPSRLQPGIASTEARQFLRQVWHAWWSIQPQAPVLPHPTWTRTSIRPNNAPERRLALIAMLFSRATPWQDLASILPGPPPLYTALSKCIRPDDPLAFWLHHTGFQHARHPQETALAGPAKIATWLNNTLLPLAVATQTLSLGGIIPRLMPESSNSILRATAARILGRDHNPRLYARSGLKQQGLLQVHEDFCRNGCQHCQLSNVLEADLAASG